MVRLSGLRRLRENSGSRLIPAMLDLFHTLFRIYGEQHWWPCKSGRRWEIAAGAVLVQNTAWTNVEKALANLENADRMTPERILSASDDDLRKLIRPAGFYMQKIIKLTFLFRNLTPFYLVIVPFIWKCTANKSGNYSIPCN